MLVTKKGFQRNAREIPAESLFEAHQRALEALKAAAHVRVWKFEVLDQFRKVVAHVSWNGRMWEGPAAYDSRHEPDEIVFNGTYARKVAPR